jgi:nitroreductase
MKLEDAIKKRQSIRKYADKKPDWRKIIRCIDAARHAPSAGNHFITRFILISDKDKINKIATACSQDFVGDVEYIVAVVSDDATLTKHYGKKLGERYARQQAGAAIQNFLLQITAEDLVTCWIGFYEESHIKKNLGIPEQKNIVVEALFPIGKETKVKTPQKQKTDLETITFFDKWNNKKMVPEKRTSVKAI